MKPRWMALTLIAVLALVLTCQSIVATQATAAGAVGKLNEGDTAAKPAASCGQLSFAITSYSSITNPTISAIGDFNGDGKTDLAIANYDSGNELAIMLNNGDGTFGTPLHYSTGFSQGNVLGLVVGDFNADGKQDVALTIANIDNQRENKVLVMLGNGSGGFQFNASYDVGMYPTWVGAADFNRDGKLDLVTSNGYDGDLSVLLGRGDGSFNAAVNIYPGAGYLALTRSIISDFNRDGIPDIGAVNGLNGSIEVLLGNGDGSFRSAGYFAALHGLSGVVQGDFNNDNRTDVVAFDGFRIASLLGDGAGNLSHPNYTTSSNPYVSGVAAGDMNGDGNLDFVSGDGSGNLNIYPGNGQGGFDVPLSFADSDGVFAMTVADLNADGKPDVVSANSHNLSVLLNTCAPITATPPTNTPTSTPPPTYPPAPTSTPCPVPYTDIIGNPFYKAIQNLYCRRAINGTGATTFSPSWTADRAQFTKILVPALDIYSYFPGDDFSDVPRSHYANIYIVAAYYAGLVNGASAAACAAAGVTYPCFLPQHPITRAELTKIVVGASYYQLITPPTPSFSDVPTTNPFYSYIETAYAHGLIMGYPDHTFRPNQGIRRDEMAQIIYTAAVNAGYSTPRQPGLPSTPAAMKH